MRAQLLEELFGADQEYYQLYRTNALFKLGVENLLNNFMPVFLEGLKYYAIRDNERQRREVERLTRGVL